MHGNSRRLEREVVADEVRDGAERVASVGTVADLVAALHEADLTVGFPRTSIMYHCRGAVSRAARIGCQSTITLLSKHPAMHDSGDGRSGAVEQSLYLG